MLGGAQVVQGFATMICVEVCFPSGPGFFCGSPQYTELAQLPTLRVWTCSIPWDHASVFCTVGSDKCSTTPPHSIPLSCSEFGTWALPTCDPIPSPTWLVHSWPQLESCPVLPRSPSLVLQPIQWSAIGVGSLQKKAACVQIC